MLISKSGLNRVANWLSSLGNEQGPHWFFTSTWDINVFEGSVFEGEPPADDDPIWIDIGRQTAEYLASRQGRFAVCIPLLTLPTLPDAGFDPTSLERLDPLMFWATHTVYSVNFEGGPYETRETKWHSDEIKQPTGVHAWVSAFLDDEPADVEGKGPVYRVDLWFETKQKPILTKTPES